MSAAKMAAILSRPQCVKQVNMESHVRCMVLDIPQDQLLLALKTFHSTPIG